MARFKLKDIGTIITGNTPKTSDSRNYDSNDICFVKPSDIDDNELSDLCSSECYISEYARSKARIVPAQSILVTCIGIIGKVGINSVDCAFNQQINAIIPNIEKCDCRYLAYAIQRERPKLQSIANAPVVPILNKSQFSDIEIPLPSLEEQRKIAAVLDKVSDLIAKRRTQLDKLDELVKSRFIEMFGDVTKNEKNWSTRKISEIATLQSGGTPSRQCPKYFEGTIPWITTVALGKNAIGIEDAIEYITEEAIENSATKLIPKNSLLFGIRVGVGKVSENIVPMCINQDIVAIIINDRYKLNMLFLKNLLDMFSGYFNSQKRGATIQGIKSEVLKNISVSLPPIELQNQFADFVEQTEKTKTTISHSLEKLETLKKALMQKYFG